MLSKKDEMRINVYYQTLDQLIAGLNLRFNQETIKMIDRKYGSFIEIRNPSSDDIFLLSSVFDLDAAYLETEIRLLKQSTDLSESNKANCEKWMDWLTISGTSREVIFCNVYKSLKSFIIIPVTTCSCERSFSKLSIFKTKLRSAMLQERLDNLLTMFIEQEELAYNVDLDDVIET